MQKTFEKKLETGLKIILSLLIAVLVLPLSPTMPASTLDPSWVLGLIQAQAQQLSFGKDIVFTYGPYSFLLTKAYHPNLVGLMWFGCAWFATSYICLCWQTLKNIHVFYLSFIVIVFGFLVQSQDAVLFIYPLLFGLWIWKNTLNNIQKSVYFNFYLCLFSSTLGLLLLVKGNVGILGLGILFCCSIWLLTSRRYLSLLLMWLAFAISCIVFWIFAQQSIANLPAYFVNTFEISKGYTQAMAICNEARHIMLVVLFIIPTSILLVYLFRKTKSDYKMDQISSLLLTLLFAYFFFVIFKTGFVRNDLHCIATGHCLMFASIMLFSITSPIPNLKIFLCTIKKFLFFKILFISLVLSIASMQLRYIQASFVFPDIPYIFPFSNVQHLFTWISTPSWSEQYQARLDAIAQTKPLPTLAGTSDIYEHDQAILIASKNTWNPRPVFQSYSAYTPKLAQMNQAHLLSQRAPDHIFFYVGISYENIFPTLDNRYPSLNDGLSWPVLLQRYQPSPTQTEHFLILDRASNAQIFVPPVNINEQNAKIGELVFMPISAINDEKPIFVELHIQPNLFGKIAETFYKTSELLIEVQLDNGQTKQHRIIANMTQTGFVLSPYISSHKDFATLYLNQSHSQNHLPRVKQFKVFTTKGGSWLWQPEYQIVFKQ